MSISYVGRLSGYHGLVCDMCTMVWVYYLCTMGWSVICVSLVGDLYTMGWSATCVS